MGRSTASPSLHLHAPYKPPAECGTVTPFLWRWFKVILGNVGDISSFKGTSKCKMCFLSLSLEVLTKGTGWRSAWGAWRGKKNLICLFPGIIARLLEMIHGPHCQRLHVGAIFFQPRFHETTGTAESRCDCSREQYRKSTSNGSCARNDSPTILISCYCGYIDAIVGAVCC